MMVKTVDAARAAHLTRVLLEQATEHAALALCPNATIVWANAAAARILDYELDALCGMHLSAIFTPEEQALGIPELEIGIARAGSASEDDRWQQQRDGTRFWANGALMPLHDDDGTLIGFGKIFRNRSDLRLQFDTLQNQLDTATALGTRRDRYIATFAHELRNPLTPLLMTCTLLRAASADPRVLDAATIIERQVAEMTRVIDRALDTAMSRPGVIPLESTLVSMNALLAEVKTQMYPPASARSQVLTLLVPESPLVVCGDRERLSQVFLNLVSNAIKFTPAGGRIWMKLSKEGKQIVARVEDNGIGLGREQMERIFEMFARADPAADVPGFGIGLAIVKTAVELHDGTVQVESDGPGTGCKFTVRLPMFLANAAQQDLP